MAADVVLGVHYIHQQHTITADDASACVAMSSELGVLM